MQLEELSSSTPKEWRGMIKEQMAQDLEILLQRFKNRDIGLRILSEKTNINEKTLKRVINQASDPHTNTIRSFYSYFFTVQNNEAPSELHQFIKRLIAKEIGSPQTLLQIGTEKLEEMLGNNKVFRDIYLYSRTGYVTKSWVQEEFGNYGVEVLELMLREDLLIEVDKNLYAQGAIGVAKPPYVLKSILNDLVNNHLDQDRLSERGTNGAFFLVEGVSEEVKQEVLSRMEQFRQELSDLIFDEKSKGKERLFVISAADTLKEKILN